MSRQPHIEPRDTPPLSTKIAVKLLWCDPDETTITRRELEQWLQIASAWEKLAAEFQAARNEDEPLVRERYAATANECFGAILDLDMLYRRQIAYMARHKGKINARYTMEIENKRLALGLQSTILRKE